MLRWHWSKASMVSLLPHQRKGEVIGPPDREGGSDQPCDWFSDRDRDQSAGSRLRVPVLRSPLFQAERDVQMRFAAEGLLFNHDSQTGPAGCRIAADKLVHIVESPTVVFANRQRDNDGEAFCYVGQIAEARTGFVFLAFAMLDEDEMFFTDWAYRSEDPRKRGYPVNWRTAFRDSEILLGGGKSAPSVVAGCHFKMRSK